MVGVILERIKSGIDCVISRQYFGKEDRVANKSSNYKTNCEKRYIIEYKADGIHSSTSVKPSIVYTCHQSGIF